MGFGDNAVAFAAVCGGFAAGWLVRRRHEPQHEPARPEPSQPAAAHSSVRGQYHVFISHAGPQKDFALWVRSHVRICGYRAFVDERDLRYVFARSWLAASGAMVSFQDHDTPYCEHSIFYKDP